jgi:hypothetical protein
MVERAVDRTEFREWVARGANFYRKTLDDVREYQPAFCADDRRGRIHRESRMRVYKTLDRDQAISLLHDWDGSAEWPTRRR